MMEETYYFEKLNVWQQSRQLVAQVYKLLEKFPDEEKYA